jgi:hypothetical protein
MPPESPEVSRRETVHLVLWHGDHASSALWLQRLAGYDELLLARCGRDWRPAPRVVGEAMEAADEILGDGFFAWRLRRLAEAGRLALRGEFDEDLAFAVRRP